MPMLPKPLSAIIFDKDGLLFDVEPIERAAAITACSMVGYSMSPSWYQSFIGNPRDANDDRIRARYGSDFPFEEYHRSRKQVFDEISRSGIPLKDGAAEILQLLPELGIRVAVATSSSAERARRELVGAGLELYVEVLVSRDDVVRGKPHPESYSRACELLELSPSVCLALEDSPSGALSALGAGIPTILIPDMVRAPASVAERCVTVTRSLGEVAKMIMEGIDTR